MSTASDTRVLAATLLGVLAVSGCAGVQPTAGLSEVEKQVSTRIGETVRWNQGHDEDRAIGARVRKLLEGELTIEEATEIALLNNRGLQATYQRLGISQADLVEAGLLDNPELSLQYLFGDEGDLLEASIVQPFIGVVTLAARKKIGAAQAEQVRLGPGTLGGRYPSADPRAAGPGLHAGGHPQWQHVAVEDGR